VSVFQLSFDVQSVPLSLIGVSFSVAAFPTLSRLYARNKREEYVVQVARALRHILFWSLPSVALFIVLRAQLVRVIFGSGQFDWEATRLTAASLALFALSLPAQSVVLLFVRGFYAAGRTRIPVVVGALASLTTISLALFGLMLGATDIAPSMSLALERALRLSHIADMRVVMLPLAFSLGMLANAVALWILFEKKVVRERLSLLHRVKKSVLESLLASSTLALVSWVLLRLLAPMLNLTTLVSVFLQGALAGTGGIIAFFVVLLWVGNKNIEWVKRFIPLPQKEKVKEKAR
jgi:peptidoglycan biosynthesis protein MviN/MurJ (putative lipid II flippase)